MNAWLVALTLFFAIAPAVVVIVIHLANKRRS